MLQDSPATFSRRASRLFAGTAIGVALAAMIPMQLVARQSPSSSQPGAQSTVPAPKVEQQSRELSYVFLDDAVTKLSGPAADVDAARRLKRANEPLLWFRHGGRDYVIRDPVTLQQVQLVARVGGEEGREQAQLDEHFARLSLEQGRIGQKLGELQFEQAMRKMQEGLRDLQQKMNALQEEMALVQEAGRLQPKADRSAMERDRRAEEERFLEMTKEFRAFNESLFREKAFQDRQLSEQFEELHKPDRELNEAMEKMLQSEELARNAAQQAHQLEAEIRALIERALASGLAQVIR